MIGDLVAVKKKRIDPVGELISVFTHSDITHVGMMLDGDSFIESTATGIKISKLSSLKRREYYICLLKTPESRKMHKQRQEIIKYIHDELLAKPYDYMQFFKFIPYITLGVKPKEDNRLFICSELVSHLWEKFGVLKDINTSAITPADLFNMDDLYLGKVKYEKQMPRVQM